MIWAKSSTRRGLWRVGCRLSGAGGPGCAAGWKTLTGERVYARFGRSRSQAQANGSGLHANTPANQNCRSSLAVLSTDLASGVVGCNESAESHCEEFG